MSTHAPQPVNSIPSDAQIAIFAARFNAHIVDTLLEGCLLRLRELQLPESQVLVQRVPGAFELPLAAQLAARTKRFDAIICLGCVIRGETAHFEYVSGECARGLQNVALKEGLPVIFGVLTTENEAQAVQRAGGTHGHVGRSSADAAAEMIALARKLQS